MGWFRAGIWTTAGLVAAGLGAVEVLPEIPEVGSDLLWAAMDHPGGVFAAAFALGRFAGPRKPKLIRKPKDCCWVEPGDVD